MQSLTKRQLQLAALALFACFGVFVLPFLLPPKPIQGISAANVAAFNNKVAALAVAAASLVSLLYFYVRGGSSDGSVEKNEGDFRPLPGVLIATVILIVCGLLAAVGVMLLRSRLMYRDDLDYFVNRLSQHTVFGRRLYDQIEFPYGPLLFYAPLLVQKLLLPLHLSLRSAYVVSLSCFHVLGLLLLAYVVNALRMTRRWKILAFTGLSLLTIQLDFGLNYTLDRFLIPFACLAFALRRQQTWSIAISVALCQMLCLATSPEMGFAFLAGTLAFAGYRALLERSSQVWIIALVPLPAALLFFRLAGGGYLRMLGMFSRGVYNLVVEPLPYMLVFLFAVCGLVPWLMAGQFRSRSQSAPLLCALYVASLALLPVALGRCDPDHVLLNGMCFYLLSFVAVSSVRRSRQLAWGAVATLTFLFTALYTGRGSLFPLKVNLVSAMRKTRGVDQAATALAHHTSMGWAKLMLSSAPEETLDLVRLLALTGGERMVTPITTSRAVQEGLADAGLLAPTFYYFQVAVIDRQAELHEAEELNQQKWALIPADEPIQLREPLYDQPIGPQFQYRQKRIPYVTGLLFEQNLRQNWHPVAAVGRYILYRRKDGGSAVSGGQQKQPMAKSAAS